ncbi:siderophore-interacting protein [Streptomyces sp. NPDC014623]|uniref:siderophore-interacting protein n=1 Tax=Streptomyces sp. NPDC014623 TaxID=3364875 RepID=UPI0037022623
MLVTVAGVRRLTPRMVRITLAGDGVGDFHYAGPDHLVRLFLPVGEELQLPTSSDWWAELQAMPADRRPAVRNYTVRHIDHARRRLDIDFALHGDSGPASARTVERPEWPQISLQRILAASACGPAPAAS